MHTISYVWERIGAVGNKWDWHIHENGGGWIQNSAVVPDGCVISEDAIVGGSTIITCGDGTTKITENAVVMDAVVGSLVRIGGDARTVAGAVIPDRAVLIGGTLIGSLAVFPPVLALGWENMCAPGIVRMGCEIGTPQWWDENVERLGEKHNAPHLVDYYRNRALELAAMPSPFLVTS